VTAHGDPLLDAADPDAARLLDAGGLLDMAYVAYDLLNGRALVGFLSRGRCHGRRFLRVSELGQTGQDQGRDCEDDTK